MSKLENKIIVIYVGVAGIRSEDIDEYTHDVAKRIIPLSVQAEFILIPIQSFDTRMECINPKYITNDELIMKHNVLMHELSIELEHQIKNLREKNEKN